MRRRATPLLLAFLAGCASLGTGPRRQDLYDSPIRQVNVTIGARSLDDSAWGSLDEPYTVGIDYTEDLNSRWLFLEGGLHYAHDSTHTNNGDSNIQTDISFYDFSAGVLLEWPGYRAILRPYAGAGGALVFADAHVEDSTTERGNDATFGAYFKVGVLIPVSHDSHVGVEVRALNGGTVSTDLGDADIDFVQLAIVFGASF